MSSKSQSHIQILEIFLQSQYSNLESSKADLVGSKSTKNLFSITFFRCVTCVFLFLPKELKYLTNPLSDGYILSSDMSSIFRQDIIKSCLPGRHSDF